MWWNEVLRCFLTQKKQKQKQLVHKNTNLVLGFRDTQLADQPLPTLNDRPILLAPLASSSSAANQRRFCCCGFIWLRRLAAWTRELGEKLQVSLCLSAVTLYISGYYEDFGQMLLLMHVLTRKRVRGKYTHVSAYPACFLASRILLLMSHAALPKDTAVPVPAATCSALNTGLLFFFLS